MNDVYLSIRKVAMIIGVSTQTLRNWDKSGYFKPDQIRSNGYRYYSKEHLESFLEQYNTCKNNNRLNIGYCRVSTNKQKDDLNRQCTNIELYLKTLGTPYTIIKDIGSGINYNKKGLTELIRLICKNQVNTVYVLYKDRLVRFGFELIKYIAELHNTDIVILDSEDKTKEQELIEDLMQIITVFSCRLHGKRANKTKQIMEQLVSLQKEDDNSE